MAHVPRMPKTNRSVVEECCLLEDNGASMVILYLFTHMWTSMLILCSYK